MSKYNTFHVFFTIFFKIKKSPHFDLSDNQPFPYQTEVNINQNQTYQSYLLRLWQVGRGVSAGPAWCASLENPHTGAVLKFSSLQRLFEFLTDQCGNDISSQGAPSEKGLPHG